MSLIEEVMRRQAHERAGMGGFAAGANGAVAPAPPPARAVRHVSPPAPEMVQQYRPAAVDPDALERNRILLRVQDVAVSRAYKILRTRVLHRMAEHNWFTLGVTGTGAGEGKTVTAIVEAMDRNVKSGLQQLSAGLAQYFTAHPPQAAAAK